MVVFIARMRKNQGRELRKINCFININFVNLTVQNRLTNGIPLPTLTRNKKRGPSRSLPVWIVALLRCHIKITKEGSIPLLRMVKLYRWAAAQAMETLLRKLQTIALCFKRRIIIFFSLLRNSSHISVWSDWARQTHPHRFKSLSNTQTLVEKTRDVSKRQPVSEACSQWLPYPSKNEILILTSRK